MNENKKRRRKDGTVRNGTDRTSGTTHRRNARATGEDAGNAAAMRTEADGASEHRVTQKGQETSSRQLDDGCMAQRTLEPESDDGGMIRTRQSNAKRSSAEQKEAEQRKARKNKATAPQNARRTADDSLMHAENPQSRLTPGANCLFFPLHLLLPLSLQAHSCISPPPFPLFFARFVFPASASLHTRSPSLPPSPIRSIVSTHRASSALGGRRDAPTRGRSIYTLEGAAVIRFPIAPPQAKAGGNSPERRGGGTGNLRSPGQRNPALPLLFSLPRFLSHGLRRLWKRGLRL